MVILGKCSGASRLRSLRSPRGGLDPPSALLPEALIGAAGILEKEKIMWQTSLTPSITVAIGRHTRVYAAFVTTAPIELDAPATVTLHAGPFSEVAGFAADPEPHTCGR